MQPKGDALDAEAAQVATERGAAEDAERRRRAAAIISAGFQGFLHPNGPQVRCTTTTIRRDVPDTCRED